MNLRGGWKSPRDISMLAEQWAIAWEGVMVPHWRGLCGCNVSSLALTSFAVAGSNRFFMHESVKAGVVLLREDLALVPGVTGHRLRRGPYSGGSERGGC